MVTLAKSLKLPRTFRSTHRTEGLAGFPAVDVFGQPGEQVLAPVSGTIVYPHMIPWNLKKRVGGETVYLQGDNGKTYFLTHLQGNVPSGRVRAGQPIGQVGAVPQGAWQPHIHEGLYQGTYNPGGARTAQPAAPARASGWAPSALLAYQMAIARGATPAQAKDFAAVQYGESGFNPNARNRSSGAAGLYQLLSSGYVNRANQLGGVYNPRANIGAILPDYLAYYRSHPTLVPGAAGAAVERSGEGAQYYAQGYQHLPGAPGGSAAPGSTLAPVQAPAPAAHTGMNMSAFSSTLINAMRSGGGLTPAALLSGLRAATAHMRA